MKKVNEVGIDVSAKKLDVLMENEQKAASGQFDNTSAGWKKLVKMVTASRRHAKVVLEATGNYSLGVALALDDNPRTENANDIRNQIMNAAKGAVEIGDREEAIFAAIEKLQEGDCLVVAGKGHEPGQIVGSTVLPFSDHEVVRRALTQNGGTKYGMEYGDGS